MENIKSIGKKEIRKTENKPVAAATIVVVVAGGVVVVFAAVVAFGVASGVRPWPGRLAYPFAFGGWWPVLVA
jgi:hypothetical protein